MQHMHSTLQASASVDQPSARPALPELSVPKTLTLKFTSARDLPAVTSVFNGYRKTQMDPANQIRPRSFSEIADPIMAGRAIIAEDENHDIRFVALASRHLNTDTPQNSFTEIGAVMCDVGGFNLAQTALSVLANDRAEKHEDVHALVSAQNIAPQKVFGKHLEWQTVRCDTQSTSLYDTQKRHMSPLKRASKLWYEFENRAQEKAQALIERTMETGVLVSKTGAEIGLDFAHAEI